jgi:hypothetical protein
MAPDPAGGSARFWNLVGSTLHAGEWFPVGFGAGAGGPVFNGAFVD